ncbi:hypothetical protein INR49_018251 [Caranx melampygus]|nr:hypothetical protein INR49_018251 [Caranx melampygus]
MTLACAARSWTLQDVLMHGQDYRQTDSELRNLHGDRTCFRRVCPSTSGLDAIRDAGCTHSLEGFGLCEDIQTDCDDEGTDRSHDLSHRTLG